MTDPMIDSEDEKKAPDPPAAGTERTNDLRASIVFALMQLNRTASGIPAEQRSEFFEVIKNADFCTYRPGAPIIRKGVPCERLYVLLEGSALVSADGDAPAVLEKGNLAGQESLLSGGPSDAAVTAGDTGASALAIAKETLLGNPAVYSCLLGTGLVIQGASRSYELGEKLGEGPTSQAYEIKGEKLCAKMRRLKPGDDDGAAIPGDLQLRHPNIIGIHEAVRAHGSLFTIMDCASGVSIRLKNGEQALCRTMRRLLDVFRAEGQRVSIDMTAKMFRHTAGALLYLHDKGYGHRDVKPDSIYIDVRDNDLAFMLSDFGLALPLGARPAKVEGTPHYCPPEAIAIEGPGNALTDSADFYSLAAVCFELLTGETLYSGSNVLELARRHLESEPDLSRLPTDTPMWLGKFIEQALRKNPAERPGRQEIGKLIALA